YGQYKRLRNEFTSVLTGKGLTYGGSLIRPEATGYGCVYFTQEMLRECNRHFEGQRVAISGSGNVAQYAGLKAMEMGALVISVSDSGGTLYFPEGMTAEHWHYLMDLKNERRARLQDMANELKLEFRSEERRVGKGCRARVQP